MIRIDDKRTLARLDNRLKRYEQRMPTAVAISLTKTVQAAQRDEQKEMFDVFDRPKPYTIKGVYILPASKNKLRAEVGLKRDGTTSTRGAGKYLRSQVFGGQRRLKAFEKALRNAGILPNGYYTVTATGVNLDPFGNISRGQINQMLSFFKVQATTAGYNRASSDKSKRAIERRLSKKNAAQNVQYFVGSPADGKLPFGIWQRLKFNAGSAIRPVLLFVRSAQYGDGDFDFYYVARSAVKKNMRAELLIQLRKYARGSP